METPTGAADAGQGMMRRALCALAFMTALAACEPANDAQRLAVHWQACQGAGLPDARITACSLVVDATNVTPGQKAQALVDRGMLRAQRSEDERAFADFGLALFLDPQGAAAHIQRGLLHQKRGAFAQAVVDFVAADKIDDESGGANYLPSAMAAQATTYRMQITQLSRRIAANPNVAVNYNNRCWRRAVIGEDLESALADCNRALELQPNDAEALDSRGLVNLKRGDYDAALADYGAAVALVPDRGHFIYGRGVAQYDLGMKDLAEADWRMADASEPGVAALYESYGVRLGNDEGY